MSQLRLYVDEDAAQHAVVRGLRNEGVDVLTAVEAGMASAADDEQLEFAATEDRALYSFNVGDYCQLHNEFLSSGRHHAGIVLISRQRFSVGEKIRRLVELVNSQSAEDMRDRIEFL